MRRFKSFIILLLLVFLIPTDSISLEPAREPRIKIMQLLQKWQNDFNEKKIEAVCSLYAPDLIVVYPGREDRTFHDMCRDLTTKLTDINLVYHYDSPEIEQILIENDLAVVRVTWTMQVMNQKQTVSEVIKERDLYVFVRQPDGEWKIAISYAFRKPDESRERLRINT